MAPKNKLCRVTMEPELELIGGLWSAAKRLRMARKFERWAKQLRLSGNIMFLDARDHRDLMPVLRFLALQKAVKN